VRVKCREDRRWVERLDGAVEEDEVDVGVVEDVDEVVGADVVGSEHDACMHNIHLPVRGPDQCPRRQKRRGIVAKSQQNLPMICLI
jgi:hypothetical protein